MIKCFVSVGTGNPGSAPVEEGAKDFLSKTLKDIATETERTATTSAARHRGLLDKKRYFRYNVEQGLQTVGLEEYRKRSEIEAATKAYLADQAQKFSLRDCAKNLGIKQSSTPLGFGNEIIAYNDRLNAIKAVPALPKTYFLAPPPSFEEFTGREEYMSRLELMRDRDTHTRIALYGLSGIGKTRIALEAVHKWKMFGSTSIFWIHASTAQRIEKSYLDIAERVGIVGWDSPDPKIDKLRLVKDWLEGETSGQWILVLDNADDIDMLYGGPNNLTRMADYFPRSPNGTLLLTTRNKKIGTKFATRQTILLVQALNTTESVSLLEAKVGGDFNEYDYAKLAGVLDNVPLALVQAAAFISAESFSISKYLDLYNTSDAIRIQLLSEDFEDDVRDNDIKNPVAATFAISFEHIKKSDPRAADILSIMSMLDTQAIPRSLLPLDEDIPSAKALGTLQAFSLITEASQQDQEDQLFDMHRLVRLTMHKWLAMNCELKSWARSAIASMSKRFPAGSHENRDICRTYLPHALVVLSSEHILNDHTFAEVIQPSQKILMETKTTQAALQFNVSWYFQTKGDFTSAEPIARTSLTLRETVLGKEHLHTLTSMSNLAGVLGSQGKYEEAEDIRKLH